MKLTELASSKGMWTNDPLTSYSNSSNHGQNGANHRNYGDYTVSFFGTPGYNGAFCSPCGIEPIIFYKCSLTKAIDKHWSTITRPIDKREFWTGKYRAYDWKTCVYQLENDRLLIR